MSDQAPRTPRNAYGCIGSPGIGSRRDLVWHLGCGLSGIALADLLHRDGYTA